MYQTSNTSSNPNTKIVTFIKNGDPNYSKTIQISGHRYTRFDDLLKELDKALALPHGARNVYQANSGRRVKNISDLIHNDVYVCTGFEKFKPLHSLSHSVFDSNNMGAPSSEHFQYFSETGQRYNSHGYQMGKWERVC